MSTETSRTVSSARQITRIASDASDVQGSDTCITCLV